ncbi:MAG: DUF2256 domain-containing protein [Thermodesulfobacteriota bacterium]|nr:DUF2256 domain-containing protein [Deltaproteobacteria bacterium TMED58]RZP16465.1 MAG: DUF2256 domain-containing protein [Candidatus Dadabacteria bacterium]
MKKSNLPSKICPICNKNFLWRKKWKLNWEEVIYCSKKCSNNKSLIKRLANN